MKYIIYTNEQEDQCKMYFTGTKWGPGYFNGINEAYEFDTLQEAIDAKDLLDVAFDNPIVHYVQEILCK